MEHYMALTSQKEAQAAQSEALASTKLLAAQNLLEKQTALEKQIDADREISKKARKEKTRVLKTKVDGIKKPTGLIIPEHLQSSHPKIYDLKSSRA